MAKATGSKPSIIILGAGKGLGLSIAKRFGKQGFLVIPVARKKETLTFVENELANEGISVKGYQADFAKPDQVASLFRIVEEQYGAPEVMVYNAMAFRKALPTQLKPKELAEDFQVNVGAALQAAQAVIPSMKKRGYGTLLFTGGGLALQPYPNWSSLAIGKAALRNMVYSLAAELAVNKIHAATVTIAGTIQKGTKLDPDCIAEHYWRLYLEKPGHQSIEVTLK